MTQHMIHPHVAGWEIDVPDDRVESHLRAGWLLPEPPKSKKKPETGDNKQDSIDESERKDDA